MSTGSSIYITKDNEGITINQTRTENYTAQIDHNGRQPVIKAAPDHPITLEYRSVPNDENPKTIRLHHPHALPLYTQNQLEEATNEHDVKTLRNGITRAYLTNHDTNQPGIQASRDPIGFSNHALYKTLRITQPQPLNHIHYDTQNNPLPRDEQAHNPVRAINHVTIPYDAQS